MPDAPIEPPLETPRNAAAFDAGSDNVFARIAGRYDRLCDFFSLGIHRLWKRRIAQKIVSCQGDTVFDAASGTGDVPLRVVRLLARRGSAKRIAVTDICPEMLSIARTKLASGAPHWTIHEANAHDLANVPSNSVDIYSIAFGMKICRRDLVVAEAYRVLKPGGTFFCLEASRITVPLLHSAYLKYMDWCLPTIARIATGGDDSAYNYLLKGVHQFPDQETFAAELRQVGFTSVRYENLTLGIVALHEGVKPSS
jgi:demethylmenaquinone methyltransferase/2-methoxy-6-polyprenyl-1,4-benzoquinol methylase